MSGPHGTPRPTNQQMIERTSARLCHDIEEAMGSLDRKSNASDADRLKLCRAAWGADGLAVSLADLDALSRGLPRTVTLDASALDHGTMLPAVTARILLNLLLVAADSVPAGGTIRLAGSAEDIFVRIAGPNADWPVGMALCLADENAARTAILEKHSGQMGLTALLAHAACIRLSVVFSPAQQTEPAMLRLGG